MTFFWVVVALLVVLVALMVMIIRQRTAVYKRLFSEEHFVEFASELPALREKALELIETPEQAEAEVRALVAYEAARATNPSAEAPPDLPDPPEKALFLTSAGLVFVYTITHEPDGYVHHFSLRHAGGYTAMAVGRGFIAFALRLLGIEPSRVDVQRSENTVFHAEFVLSAEEQRTFAERPILQPSHEDARSAWEQARDDADLQVEQVTTGIRI